MVDLYSRNPERIVLYGVTWCADCRRARNTFASEGVSYLDVDIDLDPKAASFVMELNRGNRSVPTIVFPDGSILVEPRNSQLAEKLGIEMET